MKKQISVNDFLHKISLPKRYFDSDFNIIDKFKDEKEVFFQLFDMYAATDVEEENRISIREALTEIKDILHDIFTIVENIFKHYEDADMMKSQQLFDELMGKIKEDIFVSDIKGNIKIELGNECYVTCLRLGRGNDFYRVRSVDNESTNISESANEIFHLPLSKREFARGGRFSLLGFPSLYLSSMLPLAWFEAGCPKQYYYSEYRYKYKYEQEKLQPVNDLKFISIHSPSDIAHWSNTVKFNNFELWKQVFIRYLKVYPLILACSFVNQRGNSPYKQEYIFPQMLMQWVQRNPEIVQGIAYFSCVDVSNIGNEFAAYNLALPATKPHNSQGYSQILTESFNWTLPKFYSIPISDLSQNKFDREVVSELIDSVKNMLQEQNLPLVYADVLMKMLSTLTQFLSLLNKCSDVNMELVLNMLKSIQDNHQYFIKVRFEDYIKKAQDAIEANREYCDDGRFEVLTTKFRLVYNQFILTKDYNNDIGAIIQKYIYSTWNSKHQNSFFKVFSTDIEELNKITTYMQNNNMLFVPCLLKNDENSFNNLKDVSKQTGQPLKLFWNTPIGDETWIKENLSNIKQPIIIKCNSVSILSPNELKQQEFICFGFDKDLIKAAL